METDEIKALIERHLELANLVLTSTHAQRQFHTDTASALRFLLQEREWKDISSAPKTRNFIGAVDGDWRVVGWHKTSHVPIYGWCLMDQGEENCDLCKPTHFFEVPSPPLRMEE